MAERPQDLAWEALVRETAANPAMERGALNVALKAIRAASRDEGLMEDGLPEEIRLRCIAYREMFPGISLTPTALAKHWVRVVAHRSQPRSEQQRAFDQLRERGA